MPILGAVAASTLFLVGCSEHEASNEARKVVRDDALAVGHELASAVFVEGPDGISTGLSRSAVDHDVGTVTNGNQASLSLWFEETVTYEAEAIRPETSESAVICVEYTVALDGGDTVIRDSSCPADVPSGDHVVRESLGSEIEIDARDAMRTLDRFPGPHDRINEYTLIAPAREILPAAEAALEPLTEQDEVHPEQVRQALDNAGIVESVDARVIGEAVTFGVAVVPGGCIFGLVEPGGLDVEAGGVIADGGCLKPH